MFIGTTEAAYRLGICTQRVRQLLYEGRIEGAKKVGRFWRIPLFKEMPKIISGTRGPQGKWKKRLQKVKTYLHVNQKKIQKNRNKKNLDPVVIVKRGNKTSYCHAVDILGPCRLVYQPNNPICTGAVVWIEVDPSTSIQTKYFST